MSESLINTRLYHLFENIFASTPRAAFVTSEGEHLYIRGETLADIATLPTSAQICLQYLQLEDGDVAICNDPYSGGSILSSFTLVAGMSAQPGSARGKGKNLADFLIAVKLALKPRVTLSEKLDQEGIRIPPTPLYIGGQMNEALFAAMSSHPDFPPELKLSLPQEIKKILELRERLQRAIAISRFDLSRLEIKKLLRASAQQMREAVYELAVGEARADFEIGPKERLKLRTEVADGKVVFDFSGSDPGVTHHLTFQGTFGACAGALLAFLRKPIPLNSGTLSVVEVIAPKGTIVNANFPKPVALGMTDGLDVIANLATQCLSAIDKTHAVANSGSTHCAIEIRFNNGKRFYDRVHPGTGASAKQAGLDGHSLWWRAQLRTSIEEIERRHPLIYESVTLRANSGGSGMNDGGAGVAKTFRVLEEAHLVWSFTDSHHKPLGYGGGKAALGPEILVYRAGSELGPDGAPIPGEKIKLPARGEMKLHPGDRVSLLAPGGGGFGAKTQT